VTGTDHAPDKDDLLRNLASIAEKLADQGVPTIEILRHAYEGASAPARVQALTEIANKILQREYDWNPVAPEFRMTPLSIQFPPEAFAIPPRLPPGPGPGHDYHNWRHVQGTHTDGRGTHPRALCDPNKCGWDPAI
jgi:hypothetical protein